MSTMVTQFARPFRTARVSRTTSRRTQISLAHPSRVNLYSAVNGVYEQHHTYSAVGVIMHCSIRTYLSSMLLIVLLADTASRAQDTWQGLHFGMNVSQVRDALSQKGFLLQQGHDAMTYDASPDFELSTSSPTLSSNFKQEVATVQGAIVAPEQIDCLSCVFPSRVALLNRADKGHHTNSITGAALSNGLTVSSRYLFVDGGSSKAK